MLSLIPAAVIATVALIVPLTLHVTRLRVPETVAQLAVGIVIGPEVLDWARGDAAVRVLSLIGLGFLLLPAGIEIDYDRLRGQVLARTCLAFVVSLALAGAVGAGLGLAGLVRSPLLLAVTLSATSLGIILPVLNDAGQLHTVFGQVIAAGATVAEVGPIVALSVFFSAHATKVGAPLLCSGRSAPVSSQSSAGSPVSSDQGGSGGPWSLCRRRRPRSACGGRSLCYYCSHPSRRSSGSRQSLVRSSPERR